MNHFGRRLAEARDGRHAGAGPGETTAPRLHPGAQARLVAINPAFVPWHADQVTRYGLSQRVVGVRTIDARIKDYMDAFVDPDTRTRLHEIFPARRGPCSRTAPTDRADRRDPHDAVRRGTGAQVDGAPVVNGIAVVVKAAEMRQAAPPLRIGEPPPGLRYALPDEQTVTEFMDHG
jgi:hypothetical protein